ncbi:unnamed protein product [Phaeothamnion confervicola]
MVLQMETGKTSRGGGGRHQEQQQVRRQIRWSDLGNIKHLANGAMASCFTATLDGETVVVKRPRPDAKDSPAEIKRQLNLERELLYSFSGQPHIVRLIGDGEHQGAPFLVLEHLSGGTLAQYLEGYKKAHQRGWSQLLGRSVHLPLSEVLEMALELARALHFLHTEASESTVRTFSLRVNFSPTDPQQGLTPGEGGATWGPVGRRSHFSGIPASLRTRRRRLGCSFFFSGPLFSECRSFCFQKMWPKPEQVYIYRDLKPENIGFATDGRLVLFDFGLCRPVSRAKGDVRGRYRLTGQTGTCRYMAPEVYQNVGYNEKVDVLGWSLIVSEMLSLSKPYAGFTVADYEEKVVGQEERPKLASNVPKPMRRLLQRCWSSCPDERPSFGVTLGLLGYLIREQRYREGGDNDGNSGGASVGGSSANSPAASAATSLLLQAKGHSRSNLFRVRETSNTSAQSCKQQRQQHAGGGSSPNNADSAPTATVVASATLSVGNSSGAGSPLHRLRLRNIFHRRAASLVRVPA